MHIHYKIVDRFYGATGGSRAFFGIGNEDRDTRRFESEASARMALQEDANESVANPGSGPQEDRWGRRFMNLDVVPETYRWCRHLGEDGLEWQEPIQFVFDGPSSPQLLTYSVFHKRSYLGTIKSESNDGREWSVRGDANQQSRFLTGYEAAQSLLRRHTVA